MIKKLKAYRKAALKYHPDKPTGDTEKFKEFLKHLIYYPMPIREKSMIIMV